MRTRCSGRCDPSSTSGRIRVAGQEGRGGMEASLGPVRRLRTVATPLTFALRCGQPHPRGVLAGGQGWDGPHKRSLEGRNRGPGRLIPRAPRSHPRRRAGSPAAPPSPARALDPEALGDHVDRLYRAAWALSGHRQDAEDLVQETYAKVLARPRLLRHDDDLGYLLRVMRNVFVSQYRTAQRRPVAAVLPEDLELADQRPASRPEAVLETREVFAAISALPEDFRDALVAVDVVGLSYREAAKLLGTKEATITSRLHRARARVAAGMESSSAGVL